ncbi:DUF4301 family protein [Flavobacterium agrisoli]|uniref:DUF4301 family protein n=1 Tax=Flavobacterium agrisoli TaxID=2793066 RepID=A0A934UKX2_9FLAO|nr:DUF4301 family protein [Flavobacterium agrisoli]MBK0371013.1 DUF4301 family protein [Flavobacterium agrisoli]
MEEKLKQQQTSIIKIALFGPESTGKTTLSQQLAAHYKTEWVPEFARDYLQQKWEENGHICVADDLLPIAYGQIELENEKLKLAHDYLFCDTNLMVTKVFSELYYGFCDPVLNEAALENEYDLTFLTDIDVPWEKDDIRDTAEGRETVFSVFKESLIQNNKPFITISGDKETRLKLATQIIADLTRAKALGLSSNEFVQIYEHGIPFENIIFQLETCKKGIAKINLIKPATLGNGIIALSEANLIKKAQYFDAKKEKLQLMKFVPASGAATRMFKFLISFLNDFDPNHESINAYINRTQDTQLPVFIIGMDKFPFFKAIDKKLRKKMPQFDTFSSDFKNYYFIKMMLTSKDFDYANKPKAVLPFHKYPEHVATPIEEHLYECLAYASAHQQSDLHFTVSENHQSLFEEIVKTVKPEIEKKANTQIRVSYSYQNKKTDSIAFNLQNEPFRDEEGKLWFRPGGHGALIENMNALDADVVFIKNIDNVIQNHIETTALYKKALAGILVKLQETVFDYLRLLETEISLEKINEIALFLKNNLNESFEVDFEEKAEEDKKAILHKKLNCPIRVCGMVKNEGEPGGGPFWVQDENGKISLQIVESSQMDLEDVNQSKIAQQASHFNPVDLVCGIKNYKGEKFDLTQFVDKNTGFIVEKSVKGKPNRSYELPGLWNGAMAKWLTVFVSVPLLTFNPVKTVNDLLKQPHQLL